MDKTTGLIAALVIAPLAIVTTVALIRGYKIDIHFDRDAAAKGDGGVSWFHRKPKDPPGDPPKAE